MSAFESGLHARARHAARPRARPGAWRLNAARQRSTSRVKGSPSRSTSSAPAASGASARRRRHRRPPRPRPRSSAGTARASTPGSRAAISGERGAGLDLRVLGEITPCGARRPPGSRAPRRAPQLLRERLGAGHVRGAEEGDHQIDRPRDRARRATSLAACSRGRAPRRGSAEMRRGPAHRRREVSVMSTHEQRRISRAMTMRWISLVPSPISMSFASRCMRSTGTSRSSRCRHGSGSPCR